MNTKKAKDLKVGDVILGGKRITKIAANFFYDKFKYNYTVYFEMINGNEYLGHKAFDYLEDANIIMDSFHAKGAA